MNSSISTALPPYSTTVQMNSSISTALTPYALTTSLSAKQNLLTASTSILGIGSNITSLNCNNISNPPNLSVYATTATLGSYSTRAQMNASISTALTPYSTTVQMNSSISSTLTPYLTTATATATYGTKTSLNLKQNILTASTTILGIGSNITSLNYNNISNPPNLSLYATTATLGSCSTTAQMNSSISTALTPYSTTTQMNSSISTALTPYALTTSLSAKQNTWTASTTILGVGSTITAIKYNISNPPSLSKYALSTDSTAKQNTLTASTTILGIVSNISLINYNNLNDLPNSGVYTTISQLANYLPLTGESLIGNLTTTGNIGIGITNPSAYKLDVRGSVECQSISIVDSTNYSSQFQSLLISPKSTTSAQIQTIQQGVGYNQNLNLQPSGGTIKLKVLQLVVLHSMLMAIV